jgi:hypothetical protein
LGWPISFEISQLLALDSFEVGYSDCVRVVGNPEVVRFIRDYELGSSFFTRPSDDEPGAGDFLFRRVVLPLLLHAFSPLPYRESASSISN